jgi:hypothetical protein
MQTNIDTLNPSLFYNSIITSRVKRIVNTIFDWLNASASTRKPVFVIDVTAIKSDLVNLLVDYIEDLGYITARNDTDLVIYNDSVVSN